MLSDGRDERWRDLDDDSSGLPEENLEEDLEEELDERERRERAISD